MAKTKPNGALKIEKGIPIPAQSGGSNVHYGWAAAVRKLGPTESVLLPTTLVSANNAVMNARKGEQAARRFTLRGVKGGTRVWRIK